MVAGSPLALAEGYGNSHRNGGNDTARREFTLPSLLFRYQKHKPFLSDIQAPGPKTGQERRFFFISIVAFFNKLMSKVMRV